MIALLLLAAVTTTAPKPLPPGMLCVDTAPCVATSGSKARVTALPEPRRFVWTSDARDIVAFGSIAADATEVVLDGGTSRVVRLYLNEPVTVGFEIASRAGKWEWSLKNPPPSIRLIHPSCEGCVLAAEAKGFRRFQKPLRATTSVVLQALPHVRGRVVDRASGEPLAGATIATEGALLGKSEADGTFDLAVEQWPRQYRGIDVSWPGRATRRVVLSPVRGDADLGTIALSTGGTIRAVIDPPLAQNLTWELRDQKARDLLREGTMAAPEVVVEGLGEGAFELVVRGERPLQQYAVPFEIAGDETVERTIAIEPATLTIEVTRGSRPYAGGTLDVSLFDRAWRGTVRLDDEGKATEELWQRGRVWADVRSGGKGVYSTGVHSVDSDESTWRIAVPDATLTGRVLDAVTGDPIPNANVAFSYRTSRERAGLIGTRSDAEGRYVFDIVDPGTHELRVSAAGYPMRENIAVTIDAASGTYEHDLLLGAKNDARMLVVTNEHGAPVGEAVVLVGTQEGVTRLATTLDGTCPLPLRPDERALIFVIPRGGSFAYLRVGPQRGGDATIPMRVRGGAATIEVETRDGGGKPLPNVYLVARFNGLMLPPEVTDALRMMQGLSFFTDASGRARLGGMPQGVYELWAVTGRDQMMAVRSDSPPPPAASLEVEAGHYNVTIDFSAR